MAIKSADFHVDYSDIHRHWDPHSEHFAGGDALITAIQQGWQLIEPVYKEDFWAAGTRVVVYHSILERGDETMVMPVLTNPFIRRGLKTRTLEVEPYENLEARLKTIRQKKAKV
ncbi:MAG: hypothetical protein KME04_05135 [Pleurocapsa minor GSE-CHR-MK-17-07R]|jgi:hypothetical protein|nr:hypothetical protein [Pleurocapsa minor GSE-CHR-MK 17-07R]